MLYAIDNDGSKKEALPDSIAYCPHCETEMIPKCGLINIWHWAHKNKYVNCDYKSETEWHLKWKKLALSFNCDVEVSIGNNIADILNNNSKRVIELQNSSINTKSILERCENYKTEGYKVDWLFNLENKYKNDHIKFTLHDDYIGFRQKWRKRQLSFLFNSDLYPLYGRVWLDINKDLPLFLVKKLYKSGGGYGEYADRYSPISTVKLW